MCSKLTKRSRDLPWIACKWHSNRCDSIFHCHNMNDYGSRTSHLSGLEYVWWQPKSSLAKQCFPFPVNFWKLSPYALWASRCVMFIKATTLKPLTLTDYHQHLYPPKCTSVMSLERCRSSSWWGLTVLELILLFLSVFFISSCILWDLLQDNLFTARYMTGNQLSILRKHCQWSHSRTCNVAFCMKFIKRG